MDVKIIVDENSLTKGNDDVIFGKIYISVGDSSFPDKKWDDFIVVIMSWWNEELLKIMDNNEMDNNEKDYQLNFMDGPYEVVINRKPFERLELECLRRGRDKNVVLSRVSCSLNEFSNQLIKATETVIKVLESNNWDTNDIRILKDSYKNIQDKREGIPHSE